MLPKYRYFSPGSGFPLSHYQQSLLFQAGYTLVFCDVINRKVHINNGKTCDTICQETRENTAQRAEVYISSNQITFRSDEIMPKSLKQLRRNFIVELDLVMSARTGKKVYQIEPALIKL